MEEQKVTRVHVRIKDASGETLDRWENRQGWEASEEAVRMDYGDNFVEILGTATDETGGEDEQAAS